MFILKGKRVKLSTLRKWAGRTGAKGDRRISVTFTNYKYGKSRVWASVHEGTDCMVVEDARLIDDISPKILGHKWTDGKKK